MRDSIAYDILFSDIRQLVLRTVKQEVEKHTPWLVQAVLKLFVTLRITICESSWPFFYRVFSPVSIGREIPWEKFRYCTSSNQLFISTITWAKCWWSSTLLYSCFLLWNLQRTSKIHENSFVDRLMIGLDSRFNQSSVHWKFTSTRLYRRRFLCWKSLSDLYRSHWWSIDHSSRR